MKTNRSVVLIASVLASLHSTLLLAQAQDPASPPPPPMWYGPHMWGLGWGMWIFPLMMLLSFLLFAGLFVFGLRWGAGGHHWWPSTHMTGPGPSWRDPTDSAMQILNERYARGEIQKAEYEERKVTILSGRAR